MTTRATASRWRTVGAVAAGFFVTAVLSIATDAVMHATGVFPPWGAPMADGLFVWATLYRLTYTVVGGYVTAGLSPHHPMSHVIALGAIGTLAATMGAVATWNAGPAFGPKWYPILLVVTALPSVWAGGILREKARASFVKTASTGETRARVPRSRDRVRTDVLRRETR